MILQFQLTSMYIFLRFWLLIRILLIILFISTSIILATHNLYINNIKKQLINSLARIINCFYLCCSYEQNPASVNEHKIVATEKNPKLNAAIAENASAK